MIKLGLGEAERSYPGLRIRMIRMMIVIIKHHISAIPEEALKGLGLSLLLELSQEHKPSLRAWVFP